MTALENWLQRATRGLSKDSAAQVRSEIRQHYEAARDHAVIDGATLAGAESMALNALGDAKTVNCQYRCVLLTSAEARMLGDGNREARAVCVRPWLKWLLKTIPIACLSAAAAFFFAGATPAARGFLAAAIGMGVPLAAPFLPIYTPSRARIFRCLKWLGLATALALILGPDTLKFSWLLISCVWPLVWVEWTRASIRRKLRVADWPKQLYL